MANKILPEPEPDVINATLTESLSDALRRARKQHARTPLPMPEPSARAWAMLARARARHRPGP
jgi:hypothetical protein